ncbi:MAG TPA: hypothetical protein VLL52_03730 [Anaerolineae bacterium]|nr:hypothetical protein [Anaerolineae bacterium]
MAIKYISKTELARETSRVIRETEAGYATVVAHHGRPEAVLVPAAVYFLMRAALRYYQPGMGPSGGEDDGQRVYDEALGAYLKGEEGVREMAERLEMPELQLRTYLATVPILAPPQDRGEQWMAFEALLEANMVDTDIVDLAENHDRYLYDQLRGDDDKG